MLCWRRRKGETSSLFSLLEHTWVPVLLWLTREGKFRHTVHKEADLNHPPGVFFLLLISQSRCIVPCIILPKLGLLLGYVLGILCLLANMEIMESLVLISMAVYQQIVYLCYTAIRYLVRMPCGLFRWPELWKRTITLAQVCNFCSVLPNWSNKGILHARCFSKFHR